MAAEEAMWRLGEGKENREMEVLEKDCDVFGETLRCFFKNIGMFFGESNNYPNGHGDGQRRTAPKNGDNGDISY